MPGRLAGRHTCSQADWQTNRYIRKQTDRWTGRHIGRQIVRQMDKGLREVYIWIEGQTGSKTDKQSD